jgi:hypothetical protein
MGLVGVWRWSSGSIRVHRGSVGLEINGEAKLEAQYAKGLMVPFDGSHGSEHVTIGPTAAKYDHAVRARIFSESNLRWAPGLNRWMSGLREIQVP